MESGGGECGVERDRGGVVWGEEGRGVGGGVGIFRLHEDEGHACFGPVGFEESREGAVTAAEEGV